MKTKLFLAAISIILVNIDIAVLLYSCQSSNRIGPVAEKEIKPSIDKYLQTQKFIADVLGSGSLKNSKSFCSYQLLGADKLVGANNLNAYLWVLCEEYSKEIQEGSAVSLPVVTTINNQHNKYQVIRHQYPGEGSRYTEDNKRLFPRDILKKIYASERNQIVENLSKQNLAKAKAYFPKN